MDDFASLLQAYKFNLAEYRVTGNVVNKTAYELAQKGLDDRIAAQTQNIGRNETYIQEFLSKYQNTNKTLIDLQAKSKQIQAEGPRLQDEYIKAQRLNPASEVSNTALYVKGAIVAGLVMLIVLVGRG